MPPTLLGWCTARQEECLGFTRDDYMLYLRIVAAIELRQQYCGTSKPTCLLNAITYTWYQVTAFFWPVALRSYSARKDDST